MSSASKDVQEATPILAWVSSLIKGYTFKARGQGHSKTNGNYDRTLDEPVSLQVKGMSEPMAIPAGSSVVIYGDPSKLRASSDRVGTIMQYERGRLAKQISIRRSGTVVITTF